MMENDGWGWDRMVNYRGYNEDIMKKNPVDGRNPAPVGNYERYL